MIRKFCSFSQLFFIKQLILRRSFLADLLLAAVNYWVIPIKFYY